MLRDSTIVRRNAAFQHHALEKASILAHSAAHSYFTVNRVGTRIWAILENPRTVREIVQILLREFQVDEPTCRQETDAFLTQLITRELAVIEAG